MLVLGRGAREFSIGSEVRDSDFSQVSYAVDLRGFEDERTSSGDRGRSVEQ